MQLRFAMHGSHPCRVSFRLSNRWRERRERQTRNQKGKGKAKRKREERNEKKKVNVGCTDRYSGHVAHLHPNADGLLRCLSSACMQLVVAAQS